MGGLLVRREQKDLGRNTFCILKTLADEVQQRSHFGNGVNRLADGGLALGHVQHLLRRLVDGAQPAGTAHHQHAIAHALHHHILDAALQAQQFVAGTGLDLLQAVMA